MNNISIRGAPLKELLSEIKFNASKKFGKGFSEEPSQEKLLLFASKLWHEDLFVELCEIWSDIFSFEPEDSIIFYLMVFLS